MNEEFSVEELSEIDEEREIFFNIINRYLGFYTREAHRLTQNKTSQEYPFIAMDTRQVFEQITFVKRYLEEQHGPIKDGQFSFVDVGCGTGNILLIAEQFLFAVYGLEKDAFPVSIAKGLIGEEKIFQEDIRTHADYGKYDVVYYFCPLSLGEQQRKLEIFIEEAMKPGAILIANQKRSDAIANDPRFKRLHDKYQIWAKICLE
jgi:SAM-dependent methyltransferase